MIAAAERSGFSVRTIQPLEVRNGEISLWASFCGFQVVDVRVVRHDDLDEPVEVLAMTHDPEVGELSVYEHTSIDDKKVLDVAWDVIRQRIDEEVDKWWGPL